MLGAGEQLRELTTTVGQLLDHDEKDVREWDKVLHKGLSAYTMAAFTLFTKDGNVSSCSSILVTVKQRKFETSDESTSKDLGPHSSCVSG